ASPSRTAASKPSDEAAVIFVTLATAISFLPTTLTANTRFDCQRKHDTASRVFPVSVVGYFHLPTFSNGFSSNISGRSRQPPLASTCDRDSRCREEQGGPAV